MSAARAPRRVGQRQLGGHRAAFDAFPKEQFRGATALLLDAELLTTNVRHFPMIEDLKPAYR